jgi:hypothetical protein
MDAHKRRASNNRLKAHTNGWVRSIMLGIAANPIVLLETVAAGPFQFRVRFIREGLSLGMAVDETVANAVFHFFSEQVVKRYGQTAGRVLDQLDIRTPPTEKEIEDAWVHDVESSYDAKRLFNQV